MQTFKRENRVPMLISDKVDFGTKKITRDREGCYIMIKRLNEPGKLILNMHQITELQKIRHKN